MQVDLLQPCTVEEMSEQTHQTMIEAIIVFVYRVIDQVEVACQQLGA
jgi:hypothetical protein